MKQSVSTGINWRRIIFFMVLVTGIGIAYYFARDYISLDMLRVHGNKLRTLVDKYYVLSVLVYMGVYVGVLACSLPFVAPLSVAGGYLFGIKLGFVYAIISAMIGAGIGFLLLRYFMTPESLSEKHKKFKKLEEQLRKNGVLYLLMLNFTSVAPIAVVNTVAVLANMSLATVLWTTGVGSAPFVAVYIVAGSKFKTAQSFRDFFSLKLFILLGVVGLGVFIVSKLVQRSRSNKGSHA